MSIMSIILISSLVMLINLLFILAMKKYKWELWGSSSFECGYTSYFFSHFSFSIHYFLIALMFLFLDLELCFVMPFMNENMTDSSPTIYMFLFLSIVLAGLMLEWKEGKIEWIF